MRGAAPLLCRRVLQQRGGGGGRRAGYLHGRGLTLTQKDSVGWGLHAPGETPPPCQPQGLGGSQPCSSARAESFETVPCTQHGLETTARLWHVLCSVRVMVATGVTAHTPDLGAWQLQNLPCLFAPCLVSRDGQNWRLPALPRRCQDVTLEMTQEEEKRHGPYPLWGTLQSWGEGKGWGGGLGGQGWDVSKEREQQ